jgi:hypothetical protein
MAGAMTAGGEAVDPDTLTLPDGGDDWRFVGLIILLLAAVVTRKAGFPRYARCLAGSGAASRSRADGRQGEVSGQTPGGDRRWRADRIDAGG